MAIGIDDFYRQQMMQQAMQDMQKQQFLAGAICSGSVGAIQQGYANQNIEKKREEAPKPQLNEVLLLLEDL